MSNPPNNPVDFYTLQIAPGGRFAVRGWNDQRILSIHERQRDAREAAKRLNLDGHTTASVEIPEPVIYGAAQRAERDGMTLADWIADVVEERVRNDELSDRVWRRHAEGASPKALGEILDLIRGERPPDPGDELPESYER